MEHTQTQTEGAKMTRASIVLVTLALALPAAAQAGVVTRTEDPVAKAIAAADAYWGAAPCAGHDQIVYEEAPNVAVDAGPDNQGVASGELIVQAWAREGDTTACAIHLITRFWTAATEVSDYQTFCVVMTHEIGHFLGHEDAGQTDPTSVQYPTIAAGGPNYNSVPQCTGQTATHEEWVTTAAEKKLEEEELSPSNLTHWHRRHHSKRHPKGRHHR